MMRLRSSARRHPSPRRAIPAWQKQPREQLRPPGSQPAACGRPAAEPTARTASSASAQTERERGQGQRSGDLPVGDACAPRHITCAVPRCPALFHLCRGWCVVHPPPHHAILAGNCHPTPPVSVRGPFRSPCPVEQRRSHLASTSVCCAPALRSRTRPPLGVLRALGGRASARRLRRVLQGAVVVPCLSHNVYAPPLHLPTVVAPTPPMPVPLCL